MEHDAVSYIDKRPTDVDNTYVQACGWKQGELCEEETKGRWYRRQGLGADCEHNTTVCLHKQAIKEPIVLHTHRKKPVSNGQPRPTKIITILCVQRKNS